MRAVVSTRARCAACRLRGLDESFRAHAAGEPVFDDLRRWNGAEWKRGPVERFTGWRWNGATWNRLELAKAGRIRNRWVGESRFRRRIGGPRLRGGPRCSICRVENYVKGLMLRIGGGDRVHPEERQTLARHASD